MAFNLEEIGSAIFGGKEMYMDLDSGRIFPCWLVSQRIEALPDHCAKLPVHSATFAPYRYIRALLKADSAALELCRNPIRCWKRCRSLIRIAMNRFTRSSRPSFAKPIRALFCTRARIRPMNQRRSCPSTRNSTALSASDLPQNGMQSSAPRRRTRPRIDRRTQIIRDDAAYLTLLFSTPIANARPPELRPCAFDTDRIPASPRTGGRNQLVRGIHWRKISLSDADCVRSL